MRNDFEFDPKNPSPKNIWHYAQNKPSIIAEDFRSLGIPTTVTYAILMARGVFKWFAVRRDLIAYKDEIRETIKKLQIDVRMLRDARKLVPTEKHTVLSKQIEFTRGQIQAYETCLTRIREMTHSERWRIPEFDLEAKNWVLHKQHIFAENNQNKGETK